MRYHGFYTTDQPSLETFDLVVRWQATPLKPRSHLLWRGISILLRSVRSRRPATITGFVKSGQRFVVDGQPFRFVGANVAIMYRDEDRQRMPETMRQAAQAGMRVVRVWAFGEGGPSDVGPLADFADWPRTHPFRSRPAEWNEEAFRHLDNVIAQAKQQYRLQICLPTVA